MAGASSTQLNVGTGGDLIYDEDIGGGVKMAATKIHVGALGVDSGPVTSALPLPVSDVNVPAVGQKSAAASMPVVLCSGSVSQGATLAVGGIIIKNSPGSAMYIEAENTGAGAIYLQIHDRASGSPSASARPLWYSPVVAATTGVIFGQMGHTVLGVPCASGVCLIASSTQAAYTALAVNTVGYNITTI